MKSISNHFKFKFGIFGGLLAASVLTVVLALAPSKINVAHSEDCTSTMNVPTVATLNFFPVTWGSTAGIGCTDFAPIAVHNLNNSNYAPSDSAQVGDELYIRIYVHDGAQQGLNPQDTTAVNVHGSVAINGNNVSTTFTADNTNTKSDSVSVNIPSGASLQIEQGSGEFFDYQANTTSGSDNLNTSGGSFNMGDMQACFEFSKFYRFKVKVVGTATPPPAQNPNYTLTFAPHPNQPVPGGQCLVNGEVDWKVQNDPSVTSVRITVASTDTPAEHFFVDNGPLQGSNPTPWIQNNDSYTFNMYDQATGRLLKTITVPVGNIVNCGTPPPPPTAVSCTLSPVNGITTGQPVTFKASGGDGTYSWKVNGGTVTSTSQQNFTTTFNSSGTFTATVTSAGTSQSCYATVSVGNSTLICTATPSQVPVNTSTVFAVTSNNGAGSYAWVVPGQGTLFGNGISVKFPNPGTQTVTVSDANGNSGSCSVVVTANTTCTANSNAVINASAPVQNGSTYSVALTWSSTGSNQIKITQINPGSTAENTINTGPNSGSFTVNGLAAGGNYTFKMYDVTCGNLLNAVTVNTPGNPGALSCTVSATSANIGDNIVFTANGGIAPYVWSDSNNSNLFTGNPFNANFLSAGTKNIVVTANGQTANCVVVINAASTNTSGGGCSNSSCNTTSTSNNCVNNSCNTTNTNTNTNTYYSNPQSYPVYAYAPQPTIYYPPAPTPAPIIYPNVLGSSVSLSYSKKAFNNTKNADATSVSASPEDFITYTLTVSNNGSTPDQGFVVTDDLSQVLPYADITDYGGGNLNGNTINYPAVTVPANGSVSESFEVRVKYALASNIRYTMTNTYGNTVNININNPQVLGAFTAPKTGADTNGVMFAGMLTVSFLAYKKRKSLMSLIFT